MPRVLTPALASLAVQSGVLQCHVDIYDWRGRVVLLSTRRGILTRAGLTKKMEVIEGTISTDDTADIQGTVNFTVLVSAATLEDVIPFGRSDPLSPIARSRVKVRFSAEGDDPGVETTYGTYDISEIEIEETGEGVVMRIIAYDVSRRIQRAQFTQVLTIPAKVAVEDAIRVMLDPVFRDEDFNYQPSSRKTGVAHVYDVQADRLAEIKKLGTAIGYVFDFNDAGRDIGFYPDTKLTSDPAWIFTESRTADVNARMINVRRLLSDEKAYNGVIAMGDSTQSDKVPPRAEVWDTNPNSPTYFDPADPDASSYGPVPFFYVSQYLQNNKQCLDAARARLPAVMGMTEQISFDCLPNAGIEIRDAISVIRERIGVTGTYIVESIEMPMRASQGNMRLSCRERRVVT